MEYEEDNHINSIIYLQLNGVDPHFPYHIRFFPEPHSINETNPVRAIELQAQYDTHYNVSVVVCEETSAPLIGLYYQKCESTTLISVDKSIISATICVATNLQYVLCIVFSQ